MMKELRVKGKKVLTDLIKMFVVFVLVLLAVTALAHIKKHAIGTEPPTATFEDDFTGKQLNKVSIVKACSIDGGCVDNVALFASKINAYSVGLFEKFIVENPSIKVVCLLSSGGDIEQASKMASTITREGLTTCMADYYRFSDNSVINSSYCASACNLILLSSHERKQIGSLTSFSGHAAGDTATLSHGISIWEWRFSSSWIGENTGFVAAIDKANTPDLAKHKEYFETVKNINHLQEMKYLNQQEMRHYRIFTHQCDGLGSCNELSVEQELP